MHSAPNRKISISPDVISTEIFFGESLLLNVKTLSYFGLDSLGTKLWTLLQEHEDTQTVFDRLRQESPLDREQLTLKFEGILGGLQLHRLGGIARQCVSRNLWARRWEVQ